MKYLKYILVFAAGLITFWYASSPLDKYMLEIFGDNAYSFAVALFLALAVSSFVEFMLSKILKLETK